VKGPERRERSACESVSRENSRYFSPTLSLDKERADD
jgi:hypothetical protein